MHVAVSQPMQSRRLANQRFVVGRSDGRGWTVIAIQNADFRAKAEN